MIEDAGGVSYFETTIQVEGIMESALAPLIDEVVHENPHVRIKSHPKGEERKPQVEIHFSTTTEDPELAEKRLQKATNRISQLITREK